jgi:hypothetical protein
MLFGLSLLMSADVNTPCACRGMSLFGFSLTSILFFTLLVWFAIKLLRRRKKGKAARRERTEIDRWVDDMLARELHRKVGVDRDTVQRALEGTPEPDAVGAIEEAVRSVQIKFARTPDSSYEARLEVSFEDGGSSTASRLLTADQLPKEVRDEFTRTGGAFVFRTVHFPWSEPDRWS